MVMKKKIFKIAEFLRSGIKYNDSIVQELVKNHLNFLNKNDHKTSKEVYVVYF